MTNNCLFLLQLPIFMSSPYISKRKFEKKSVEEVRRLKYTPDDGVVDLANSRWKWCRKA